LSDALDGKLRLQTPPFLHWGTASEHVQLAVTAMSGHPDGTVVALAKNRNGIWLAPTREPASKKEA